MTKLITTLLSTALLGTSMHVAAWNSDNDRNDSYSRSEDQNYKYKGNFGNQYKYDLSKPTDQMRYDMDLGAQMRDRMSISPNRDLERDMGQYGGGIRR